ncbi:hypothetical protein HEP05_023350, partial [Escherichia coli]|nr:hypothetical protein [Escherichia coli]
MKIKHEHIRMAMNVWAHPDGEKVPAAKITKAYFELGMNRPGFPGECFICELRLP